MVNLEVPKLVGNLGSQEKKTLIAGFGIKKIIKLSDYNNYLEFKEKSLLNKKNVSWQNFKAFITVINLVKYLQRSDTFNKIRTLSVSGVPLISLCFVKSDPKLD